MWVLQVRITRGALNGEAWEIEDDFGEGLALELVTNCLLNSVHQSLKSADGFPNKSVKATWPVSGEKLWVPGPWERTREGRRKKTQMDRQIQGKCLPMDCTPGFVSAGNSTKMCQWGPSSAAVSLWQRERTPFAMQTDWRGNSGGRETSLVALHCQSSSDNRDGQERVIKA